MNQLIIQIIAFSIIGGVVWGVSRLLRCKPLDPGITKPRRSALQALVAVTCSMLFLCLFILIERSLQGGSLGSETRFEHLGDLISPAFYLIIFLLPAGVFIFRAGEPLKSVGITRTNLWQSAVIGMGLALLMFYFQSGGLLAKLRSLELRHGISLVYFAFVGFEEEILFRGYLQTRLITWLGKWQGWLLASVIMAVGHIPLRMVIEGKDLGNAFIDSCGLIPASIFFGFIMLRTKNVLAPAIAHTFTNWVSDMT